MRGEFPSVAKWYIASVIGVALILQIVTIMMAGRFNEGVVNLSLTQQIALTVCMYVPAIVLLAFCLLKKLPFKAMGLRPVKPKGMLLAFAIIMLLETVAFIAITRVAHFPSFEVVDGKWNMPGFATLIPMPNPSWVFVLNLPITMFVATIFAIPQAMGEEIGWRGYLQGEFVRRYGPVAGIILLGALWALFHMPVILAVFVKRKTRHGI